MKLTTLAIATSAVLASFAAQAGTMVIDDFEKRTVGTATATTGVNTTNTGNFTNAAATVNVDDRTVTINSVSIPAGGDANDIYASANVRQYAADGNGTGQLAISNVGGAGSNVTVAWSGISFASIPMTAYEVLIQMTQIDTGSVDITGSASTTRNVSAASTVNYVSLGQYAGALGSTYSTDFQTVGANVDAFFDNLTVRYTCQALDQGGAAAALRALGGEGASDGCANVPVPGSLALLGLGLFGLGALRRKA